MPRALKMLTDEELAELLSLKNLSLPADPRVLDVKFEHYEEGSSGDEGLDIYVILDDNSLSGDLRWVRVQPLFDTIHSVLQSAGESRYPRFNIGTRAQYDRRHSYDPESDE